MFLLFSFFSLPCKAICWWGEKKNHYGFSFDARCLKLIFVFIIFQAPLSSLEWVIKCFKLISIQLAIAQLLITTASKASGSNWHKTLSTIIFGTFIMCLKWGKNAWNCWSPPEWVVAENAGMMRTHTLNTFSNYLTNQLNYFSVHGKFISCFCRR